MINSKNKEEITEISVLIFICLITLIGFIAPFTHVFYNNSETPGIFGFSHMSSFLFATGFPTLSVAAGVLFYFVSRKLTGVLSRAFSIIAFLFAYVGVFFLTWAFSPSIKDFNPAFYYLSMIGVAFTVTIILLLFSKYIFGLIKKVEKTGDFHHQSRYKKIKMLLDQAEELHEKNEITMEEYLAVIENIEKDYLTIKKEISEENAKMIIKDYISKLS